MEKCIGKSIFIGKKSQNRRAIAKSFLFCFLLLPSFFFSSKSHAGEFVLKVLTYNVADLPLKQPNYKRFKTIGRILRARRAEGTAPHVVLLQEAFTRNSYKIVHKAEYPYSYKGPRKRFFEKKVF